MSSGCGASSPNTRYPSLSAACTAAANRTVYRRFSTQYSPVNDGRSRGSHNVAE
ncbi:Uncharacterised protein [Mycobacterium tuberculosis]|uniref:Uncharacterized protein n=1 Tax=Mycobacterium tuberculosis TaxID=1773 RepID=A0A0U0TD91_MYCTX|nr:Uncharacterised protein [Mycobacterium tuberculosis]COX40948.1 Uncharacterised protein [Mycobacterium tuberculosis]COY09033.1 Uncharacterised protein [Mycobacterium tuberculosis]